MENNILDHTSKHDQDTKAKLKIIDKEGEEFGQKIKQQSKMIQATIQLTPSQTNSLMTGTRTSKYSWRQSRTLFNNALGFSPIASQSKVAVETENIMTVKKEDWSFEKKLMYTSMRSQIAVVSSHMDPHSPTEVVQVFGHRGQLGHDRIHLRGPAGAEKLFQTRCRVISSM